MKTLCLVTPDLYGSHGGIARITTVLCKALSELASTRGWRLVVHSLHDAQGTVCDADVDAVYHPYAGSRVRFARGVLQTIHEADTCAVVYTHVNHATLSFGSRVPYWVVVHGVDVWSPLPAHRRLALQRARRVWAVSDYTNRIVRGLHDVRDVVTIHNCLALPTELVSHESTPSILLVSRLAGVLEGKRIDEAIEAFAYAKEHLSLSGWTLDIVGDGPMRPIYEALARDNGVHGEVRFHGSVSDAELNRLYTECAFFSLPSVNEGFGLVFLEAMSHGKAVVAACGGAAPEVVRNGVTGIVVSPGDIDGLASAYARLARDLGLRTKLGEAGRLEVETRFGYANYCNAIHRELAEHL